MATYITEGQVREKDQKVELSFAYSTPPFVQVDVPPSTVAAGVVVVVVVVVVVPLVEVDVPEERVPKLTKTDIRSATMIV
ncbi:hypothetical protein GCM10023188_30080 [Pontibacter saemangeumensis]|uniref:Uncharacterized protein n=1 Tax=Pontibacter saemangeumensis TaxID=1084525 RepID=A0ABP8LX44_9BACT